MYEFRKAFHNYFISKRYALRYKKNEPQRVSAVYKNEKWKW